MTENYQFNYAEIKQSALPANFLENEVSQSLEEVDEMFEDQQPGLSDESIATAAGTGPLILSLPSWHAGHNQGRDPYCLGYAGALAMAIANKKEAARKRLNREPFYNRKEIGARVCRDGCTLSSLRRQLHKGLAGKTGGIMENHGIKSSTLVNSSVNMENDIRWRVRRSLSKGMPVILAINLPGYYGAITGRLNYSFRTYVSRGNKKTYVSYPDSIGWLYDNQLDLGHAITIYGHDFSDDSFLVHNSWGKYWGYNGTARFKVSDTLYGAHSRWNPWFLFLNDRRTY